MKNKYKMIEVQIPRIASTGTHQCNVFISANHAICDTCVFLIQGLGEVRPGQWTRRLCLHDSLETGSVLPLLKAFDERGLGYLVFNPNEEFSYGSNDEYEDSVVYTFEHVFRSSFEKTDNILILAHSAGGTRTVDLLKKHCEILSSEKVAYPAELSSSLPSSSPSSSPPPIPRSYTLLGAAFTDSAHNSWSWRNIPVIGTYLSIVGVHWVCSSQPLNTVLRNPHKYGNQWNAGVDGGEGEGGKAGGNVIDRDYSDMLEVSAGTGIHEESTGRSQKTILEYFDGLLSIFRKYSLTSSSSSTTANISSSSASSSPSSSPSSSSSVPPAFSSPSSSSSSSSSLPSSYGGVLFQSALQLLVPKENGRRVVLGNPWVFEVEQLKRRLFHD